MTPYKPECIDLTPLAFVALRPVSWLSWLGPVAGLNVVYSRPCGCCGATFEINRNETSTGKVTAYRCHQCRADGVVRGWKANYRWHAIINHLKGTHA